jgi:AhpD family alkylhydroperoxidase
MAQRLTFQETPREVLDVLMTAENYLNASGLDHKLLELMKYRVSQINGCARCLDIHHKEAIKLGETEQRLHTVAAWRDCTYYTDKERAVLAFAEALTKISEEDIDDELYNTLSELFSKREIVDLTLAVTQINTWNRLNRTFRMGPGNRVPADAAQAAQ